MTNKSIRDYINLIENLQREGVAEGSEQGAHVKYNQGYNDAKNSKPSIHKTLIGNDRHNYVMGYKDGLTDRKKPKEQGVAEGSESGAKILYTGKDKGGTVTISYEPDYIPGHSEKYIIRFDGKVKSEMPTLKSAVYGLTHYQFDTFRPNLQPNPKTVLQQGVAEEQLEETSPEAIAKIDQITRR